MERVTINVDCDLGEAVPEGRIKSRVLELVDLIKAGRGDELCIGQAELCTALRLEHKHGRLGAEELVFEFHSGRGVELIYVMKDGQQMTWPNGFPGDVNDSLLSGILGWGVAA